MSDPREQFEAWAALVDRRADGETLTAQEEAFCTRYASEHPEAAHELDLFAQLESLAATPDADSRSLVDAALARMEADEAERAIAEAVTFRRKRVPVFGLVTGALAIAAALFLFVRARVDAPVAHESNTGMAAQIALAPRVELVYASGAVSVSNKPANVGRTLLSEGDVIETHAGTACLVIDPEINVCLADNTQLQLAQLRSPARVLQLLGGKAATRLATQPEGMSLSISVEDVLSTAVGTAFSVERGSSGVITTVLNGKVRVGPKNDTKIVAAHERAFVSTRKQTDVSSVSRSEESPSWAMLGPTVLWHDPVSASIDVRGTPERAEAWLDDQPIGIAPLSTLVPVGAHRLSVRFEGRVLLERELHMNAGETQAIAYGEPAIVPEAVAAATPASAKQGKPHAEALGGGELEHNAKVLTPEDVGLVQPTEPAKPQTAADLLAQARRLVREGRYADAEARYEAIGREFPTSEEAHTVLVSLGQLELVQLGQPERALERLESYLERGGALSEEARVARIRALAKLGRSTDEKLAIEEFLVKHPRSFEVTALRARLAALEATR